MLGALGWGCLLSFHELQEEPILGYKKTSERMKGKNVMKINYVCIYNPPEKKFILATPMVSNQFQ